MTQETFEFGKKPFALILILIPSSGPHCEEIITVDSANTLTMGKYKEMERRDNVIEDKIIIIKYMNFIEI
jgi:hypothetical protein